MHRKLAILCCVLTLCICKETRADEIGIFVQGLIAQLGSGSYSARVNAEKTLTKMREFALPYVLGARTIKDPEIQRRILRIEDEIDCQMLWPTTRINLNAKEMLASDIYSELTKQARFQVTFVSIDRRAIPKVSLDLDQKTFWEALTTTTVNAKHDLFAYGYTRTAPACSPLVVSSSKLESCFSCDGCACSIIPREIKAAGSPELGGARLVLPITLVFEPKAQSSVAFAPRIIWKAVFDSGETMDSASEAPIFPPTSGELINPNYKVTTTLYEINQLIPLPAFKSKKITSLDLWITVYAIPRFHTRHAQIFDAPITWNIKPNQFLLSLPTRNRGFDGEISLTCRGTEEFLGLTPTLELITNSEAHLSLQNQKLVQQGDDFVTRAYSFRLRSSDVISEAKVTIPAKVVSKQFHFTFKDLELPPFLWAEK